MAERRITVFAGHYGSGKTTLAVNYALWLRQRHEQVVLCDLDIVNPYFRTADAAAPLEQAGVRLVSSRYVNSNVEVPALPPETRMIFDDRGVRAVIDLGGDDRGALALGRYAKLLLAEDDYQMLMVINRYRPLTRELADLEAVRHEIEAASRVPFTGVVNNSNLGDETTLADVAGTGDFARRTAAAMGLPLVMTAIRRDLLPAGGANEQSEDFFPVDIYKKSIWGI